MSRYRDPQVHRDHEVQVNEKMLIPLNLNQNKFNAPFCSILVCLKGKYNICMRHCWEGEMRSSQHKSPHQARAFRRGLHICMRHRWEGEMRSSQHRSPHQARAFRRGLHICMRHRWEGEMRSSQHKSPHQARAFRRGPHICMRHRWEGEMRSSQHKSPHQARAFIRGLDVVTCAEISPSRRTNDAVCIFLYEYLSESAKSNCAVKRIGESVRWADLTISLVMKNNIMSVRWADLTIRLVMKNNIVSVRWAETLQTWFNKY